jgi:hypothetical protein
MQGNVAVFEKQVNDRRSDSNLSSLPPPRLSLPTPGSPPVEIFFLLVLISDLNGFGWVTKQL